MSEATLTPKRKKVAGSGTKGPKPASTGPISRDEAYALDEFQRRTRSGDGQIRTWRRKYKLRVTKIGNVSYVNGRDFLEMLERIANGELAK